jgi:hypothetical protein
MLNLDWEWSFLIFNFLIFKIKNKILFFLSPNFLMLHQKWLLVTQEDLSKSGYKINKVKKNLGILLHVGEPLETY